MWKMEEKEENDVMELDCWKGDWGLPSVDIKCLNILVRNVTDNEIV